MSGHDRKMFACLPMYCKTRNEIRTHEKALRNEIFYGSALETSYIRAAQFLAPPGRFASQILLLQILPLQMPQ